MNEQKTENVIWQRVYYLVESDENIFIAKKNTFEGFCKVSGLERIDLHELVR